MYQWRALYEASKPDLGVPGSVKRFGAACMLCLLCCRCLRSLGHESESLPLPPCTADACEFELPLLCCAAAAGGETRLVNVPLDSLHHSLLDTLERALMPWEEEEEEEVAASIGASSGGCVDSASDATRIVVSLKPRS